MIALRSSEGLRRELPAFTEHGDMIAKSDVGGRGVTIEFAAGRLQVSVYLELEAPGFQIDEPLEQLRVLHDRDSGVVTFFLTPTQPGQRERVSLRLYQDATTREMIDTLTLYVDVLPSTGPALTPDQPGAMWQIASAMLRASSAQPSQAAVELVVNAPPPPRISPPLEQPMAAPPPTPTVSLPRPADLPQLEATAGTMNPDSPFYIERPSDPIALEAIGRTGGATVTIRGPRQIGKSSLLMHMKSAAEKAGKRVAYLDFQQVDGTALADADLFFRQFCAWVGDELDREDQTEEFWNRPSGNIRRASRYFQHYLLKELKAPVVLAMDEVDGLFQATFRSDFFGMLRAWHNNRAVEPTWRMLDLVLVTSTEPYRLIENLNQSPFNVGETIELADFSIEQVAELNRRHGAPLTADEQRRLTDLLRGHPYLIRRAFYLIAGQRFTLANLLSSATADGGPFDTHLSYYLMRLHEQKDLAQGMLQIIRAHSCAEEGVCERLESMGLARRDRGTIWPRCRLYAEYFQERLHG